MAESAGIAMAEGKPPKKGPKTLSHIEIHPQLGGGHVVRHVYSGYQHEPREYKFSKEQGRRFTSHVLRHAGLDHKTLIGEAEEEPETQMED